MKEDRGVGIEIPQKKINKHLNKLSLFFIIFSIVMAINSFVFYTAVENVIHKIFFLSGILFFVIIIIYILNWLLRNPFQLYKNGLEIHRSNFIFRILKNRYFIHFNDILKIEYLDNRSGWIRILILMKSDKKIYQSVDEKNDFDLIMNTYNNYRNDHK